MSKLQPIKINANWSAPGARPKELGCDSCRYSAYGKGFVGDSYGPETKIALLLPFPSDGEVLEQKPLSAGVGHYFLSNFVYPLGHKLAEVGVSYCLRCRVPWSKGRPDYPTGSMRAHAEESCRMYDARQMVRGKMEDGGVTAWRPDLFIVTLDPAAVVKVSAYYRQMARDVERAFQFAAEGHKPMLLCGNEAMELVAPWMVQKGGVTTWRGHWFEGEWPFAASQIARPATLPLAGALRKSLRVPEKPKKGPASPAMPEQLSLL